MEFKGNELRGEREKMTNDEFYEYVRRNKYPFDKKINRIEFIDDLYIGEKYKKLVGGFFFTDCIFQDVEIKDADFVGNIKFYRNCKGNFLEIKDCKIENSFALRGSFEDILVKNVSAKRVNIIESTIDDTLYFEKCNFELVELYTSTINSIDFSSTDVSDKTDIDLVTNKTGSTFDKCHLNLLNIKNTQIISEFVIKDSTVKRTGIKSSYFTEFKLREVIAQGEMTVQSTQIAGELLITDCTFNKSFFYTQGNILSKDWIIQPETIISAAASIEIKGSSFEEGASFIGINYSDSKNIVSHINLDFSSAIKGQLSFKEFTVEELLLSGLNSSAIVHFSNLNVLNVLIRNLTNQKVLHFNNFSPFNSNSKFEIIDSNLGNSEFFSINFKDEISLQIKDSMLMQASFVNVIWFEKEVIIPQTVEKPYTETECSKKQEIIYRQLKQVMKRDGDKPAALKFERLEWLSYKKSVTGNSNLNDRLILWSNQSNNFGLSWVKPLLLLLGFTLYFYILIVCTCFEAYREETDYSSAFGYTSVLIDKIYMYFHFLNPAHNLHFFAPEVLKNNTAMFLNVLMRFFNGYFIFQTVRAFRKFIN